MELLLLPLFFPLLLIGWVIDDQAPPKRTRRSERERERLFCETWLPVHGCAADVAETLGLAPR